MADEEIPSRFVALRQALERVRVHVTDGVRTTLTELEVQFVLGRHNRGEWGDLCHTDRESNERALRTGGRLFSEYVLTGDRKIWVISDPGSGPDRWAVTTVLLPDEY